MEQSVAFPSQIALQASLKHVKCCGSKSDTFFCSALQAHVHGDARRPEDEQPHGDQHHAGNLPGGPQNPGGVPDSHNAHLTSLKHYSCLQNSSERY